MTAWWSVSSRRPEEEFARLVEGGRAGSSTTAPELMELAGLALALRPSAVAADASFRASLRQQLLTAHPSPVAADQRPTSAGRGARRWAAATAGAAGLALAASGTAAASTTALPGEPLYGVKRGLESASLALTPSQVGKGERQLQAAAERLDEVRTILSADPGLSPETLQRARTALADLQTSTARGADLLLAAATESRGSGEEDATLAELDGFLEQAHQQMSTLDSQVPSGLAAQWRPSVALVGLLQHNVDSRIGHCAGCTGTEPLAADPTSTAQSPSPTAATPTRTSPGATAGPSGSPSAVSKPGDSAVPRSPATASSSGSPGATSGSSSASSSTSPSEGASSPSATPSARSSRLGVPTSTASSPPPPGGARPASPTGTAEETPASLGEASSFPTSTGGVGSPFDPSVSGADRGTAPR